MQPQQPTTPPLPGSSGQYDFIVNYGKNSSNSWLVAAPLKTRIIIVAGGGLVLLLIIWIGIALFTSSGNSGAQNFTTLAQEQAELVRLSQDPANHTSAVSTQNLAETTQLSVASDQQTFLAHLKALGAAPSAQTLAARHNRQADSQLAAANEAGTYDQTYVTIMQSDLSTYTSGLKQAFAVTSNLQERQMLDNAYRHAELLIALSKQNQ